MKPVFSCIACALAVGCLTAPAWAVNRCTDAAGKVSFQDAPCPGRGEQIDVRPAMEGATPIAPPPSTGKEGAFGPTWQRKNQLQTQAIPLARAAVSRQQQECAAQPQQAVAHAGPLRSTLAAGTQFAQERAAAQAQDKAACETRLQELREQLQALEKELASSP